MGRRVKDAALQTRESRRALRKSARPVWRSIEKGLTLGYYKGPRGGSWHVRLRVNGKYIFQLLGTSDDVLDADGTAVLTFGQAQEAAHAFVKARRTPTGEVQSPLTVREAADEYLAWFRINRKSIATTETFIRAHILPTLGPIEIARLRTKEIEKWRSQMAEMPRRARTSRAATEQAHGPAPTTESQIRARKSTANRVLTILKAILNRAFQQGDVANDVEWRRVKPFKSVDEGQIRYLESPDCIRLINVCPADLQKLVRAALYTGARYGELSRLTVNDINVRKQQVFISAASKAGKPRRVPLSPEGARFFAKLIKGREKNETALLRTDGEPWKHNYHLRAFVQANDEAGISPPIRFHDLRHTYATMVANLPGASLDVLAEILGHADTRITRKHYASLFDKTKLRAVANLPSLGLKE